MRIDDECSFNAHKNKEGESGFQTSANSIVCEEVFVATQWVERVSLRGHGQQVETSAGRWCVAEWMQRERGRDRMRRKGWKRNADHRVMTSSCMNKLWNGKGLHLAKYRMNGMQQQLMTENREE